MRRDEVERRPARDSLGLAWVSRELPRRDGTGGQRRQYHLIRALRDADVFSTVFVPEYGDDSPSLREIADVRRPDITVRSRGPFDFATGRRALDKLLFAGRFDAILVAHTESLALLRKSRIARGKVPLIVDHHNVMSRWAREERRRVDRLRWSAVERAIGRVAACNVVSSEEEREALAAPDSATMLVPQGFDPEEFPELGPVAGPPTLLYFGSLDFPPNRIALDWFAGQVWPTVRAQVPQARFRVVGKGSWRPRAGVSGVELRGWAPSLTPEIERAWAIVVPNQGGPGSRVKFPEAMASGRPVVSTSVGAQGCAPGARSSLALANTPRAFAEACARFLVDADGAEVAGRRARSAAMRFMTWEACAQPLVESLRHSLHPVRRDGLEATSRCA